MEVKVLEMPGILEAHLVVAPAVHQLAGQVQEVRQTPERRQLAMLGLSGILGALEAPFQPILQPQGWA